VRYLRDKVAVLCPQFHNQRNEDGDMLNRSKTPAMELMSKWDSVVLQAELFNSEHLVSSAAATCS